MSLGLYLHIPYCFSKCRYCDFYSAPGQRGVPTQYVDALLRELARFAPEAPLHPDTIYFGGGTPSLLSPADAARLIAAAAPAPGAEITLEANPDSAGDWKALRALRRAGFNRLSLGVQSTDDALLRRIGRVHTYEQVQQAVTAAEAAKKLGLDKPFWFERNGKITYTNALGDLPEVAAAYTPTYAAYQNNTTVKHITTAAQGYLDAIESMAGARALIEKSGFDYGELARGGFTQNKDGLWVQKALNAQATDKERQEMLAGRQRVHHLLVNLSGTLRQVFGGSSEAAENILRKAGFSAALYANEPDSNDTSPFNANRITNIGDDDGGAGGNYSGTGRLSSAAPKQVIVNITNLMSVETIDLLKSPEGQTAEIQHFKEQMAQALIDVVHDFDASWNG